MLLGLFSYNNPQGKCPSFPQFWRLKICALDGNQVGLFCSVTSTNVLNQGRRSLWDRGDMSPNIYERGTSMVMSPQYFRSDVIQDVDSSDSNCCLLYFNANIMCSFTKKLQFLGNFIPQTPYQGSASGPRWGTSVPRPPVFFYVPQ